MFHGLNLKYFPKRKEHINPRVLLLPAMISSIFDQVAILVSLSTTFSKIDRPKVEELAHIFELPKPKSEARALFFFALYSKLSCTTLMPLLLLAFLLWGCTRVRVLLPQ